MKVRSSYLQELALLLALSSAVHSQKPYEWPYEDKGFGYDGPWTAPYITVGTPGNKVHLFPGAFWGGLLLQPSICDQVKDPSTVFNAKCPAEGETYSPNDSSTVHFDDADTNPIKAWEDTHVEAHAIVDSVKLEGLDERVDEVAWSLVTSSTRSFEEHKPEILPPLGYMSLGGDVTYMNPIRDEDGDVYMPRVLLSYMANQTMIPSNSFGLHVGSVAYNMQGSFVYGGYDKNRAIGESVWYKIGQGEAFFMRTKISGIKGKTFTGGSDRKLDVELGGFADRGEISVKIDPATPFMYLPNNICAQFARYLPISYVKALDLYLWDTTHADYEYLIASSYIEFSFAPTNVPIRVPVSLLRLTLEAPLVEKPTAYFPCRPMADNDETWALGRAFLQAAFVGMNWDSGSLWMAQAPGPKGTKSKNIVSIGPNDEMLETSKMSWEGSWEGILITGEQARKNSEEGLSAPSPDGPLGSGDSKDSSGSGSTEKEGKKPLSVGAIAGIVIGVLVLLGALAAFLFIRHRRKNSPAYHPADSELFPRTDHTEYKGYYAGSQPPSDYDVNTVGGTTVANTSMVSELPNNAVVQELESPQYSGSHRMAPGAYVNAVELPASESSYVKPKAVLR